MPELPELEVVRDVLQARINGRVVQHVTLSGRGGPIVTRDLTGGGFAETLSGKKIGEIRRRGKFLIFDLSAANLHLVVNSKLTGRLQLADPGGKKAGPVHVTMHFSDPEEELRYVDQKRMGQLYLTTDLAQIPTYSDMGPDALEISKQEFVTRLRRFRGEIKGVLTREKLVAGIGNSTGRRQPGEGSARWRLPAK